jgi:hypothetical protein
MEEEMMIMVDLKEYEQLVRDAEWLRYLEDAGVDNWIGIDFAHELAERDGFTFEDY